MIADFQRQARMKESINTQNKNDCDLNVEDWRLIKAFFKGNCQAWKLYYLELIYKELRPRHVPKTKWCRSDERHNSSRKHCLVSRSHIKINDNSFFVEGFCRCSISGQNNILICLDMKNKAFLSVSFLSSLLRFEKSYFHCESGQRHTSFRPVW